MSILRDQLSDTWNASRSAKGARWHQFDEYAICLPKVVLKHIETLDNRSDKLGCSQRKQHAVTALVDASNFSGLSEKLARFVDGAEQISRMLTGYYDIVLPVIDHYGGECVFATQEPLNPFLPNERPGRDVKSTCSCCILCNVQLG